MAAAGDLVVEDGTGLDDANTYVSIADGDTYHGLFGNEVWTDATDDEKATALVNATQYVDFRWRFLGCPAYPATATVLGQALQWPRDNGQGGSLYDNRGNEIPPDTLPFQVVNATLEYALVYLTTGRLLKDPEVPDAAGRFVTLKREKLGPLEEETRYSDTKGTRTVYKYATADRILRESGLVVPGTGDRSVRA